MSVFTRINNKVRNTEYIRTANNADEETTKPAESESPTKPEAK